MSSYMLVLIFGAMLGVVKKFALTLSILNGGQVMGVTFRCLKWFWILCYIYCF